MTVSGNRGMKKRAETEGAQHHGLGKRLRVATLLTGGLRPVQAEGTSVAEVPVPPEVAEIKGDDESHSVAVPVVVATVSAVAVAPALKLAAPSADEEDWSTF